MKTVQILSLIRATCAVALLLQTSVHGSEAAVSELRQSQIEGLVESALAADLAGDLPLKQKLLERALTAEPSHASPHWQSGDVLIDGDWLPVELAERRAATDPTWQAYQQCLLESEDSLQGHQEMAKWCESAGLALEAESHWRSVLRFAPEHRTARARLDVQEIDGRLVLREKAQRDAEERAVRDAKSERYAKEFAAWIRMASGGDDLDRAEVLERFRCVRESDAIDALAAAAQPSGLDSKRLRRRLGDAGTQEFVEKLQLSVVSALAEIPEHAATRTLTEASLAANSPQVRRAAAAALRSRTETDYIPQLLHELEAPIEASVDVVSSSDGVVTCEATFVRRDFDADYRHSASDTELITARENADGTIDAAGFRNALARGLRRAQQKAERIRGDVAAYNQDVERRNQRVLDALRVITGEVDLAEPAQWWTAWQEYNELNVSYLRQTYDTEESYYVDTFVDAPPVATSLSTVRPSCECFAPGTQVWTRSGPRAIEQIRPGELVLSQDPTTGELDYRPVLETTAGPAKRFLNLTTDSNEQIVASPGHRFWVEGEGWVMAKFLSDSHSLHGLREDRNVTETVELEGGIAYNLVVDEFHTYFVGESRLLVHDIGCPLPTLAATPGLRKDSESFDRPQIGVGPAYSP
ncbi:MAG: hypothetical protein KDA61_04350 [Planctomycetales bacterium]|nr:hypothetical protein [Planctomycetales bacterium]